MNHIFEGWIEEDNWMDPPADMSHVPGGPVEENWSSLSRTLNPTDLDNYAPIMDDWPQCKSPSPIDPDGPKDRRINMDLIAPPSPIPPAREAVGPDPGNEPALTNLNTYDPDFRFSDLAEKSFTSSELAAVGAFDPLLQPEGCDTVMFEYEAAQARARQQQHNAPIIQSSWAGHSALPADRIPTPSAWPVPVAHTGFQPRILWVPVPRNPGFAPGMMMFTRPCHHPSVLAGPPRRLVPLPYAPPIPVRPAYLVGEQPRLPPLPPRRALRVEPPFDSRSPDTSEREPKPFSADALHPAGILISARPVKDVANAPVAGDWTVGYRQIRQREYSVWHQAIDAVTGEVAGYLPESDLPEAMRIQSRKT
jgi:hypothetical protein